MEFLDDTKLSFSGEDELRAVLPEGYRIKEVLSDRPCCLLFNRPGYKYIKFDFNAPGCNLILLP
jgi:hypothetical protein